MSYSNYSHNNPAAQGKFAPKAPVSREEALRQAQTIGEHSARTAEKECAGQARMEQLKEVAARLGIPRKAFLEARLRAAVAAEVVIEDQLSAWRRPFWWGKRFR